MEWLQLFAPIIGPLVTGLLRRAMPAIPKLLLPIIATLSGTVCAVFGGAENHTAMALGASGVAVREIQDQVRKGLGLK